MANFRVKLLGLILVGVVGLDSPDASAQDPGMEVLRAWSSSPELRVQRELLRTLVEDRNQAELRRLPRAIQGEVSTHKMTESHMYRLLGESPRPIPLEHLRALVAGTWASRSMSALLGFPRAPSGLAGAGEGAVMGRWLRVTRPTAFIELDVERSKLLHEEGVGVSQSARPDAGEWLEVKLALKRRVEIPLFSTSAFNFRTTSSCAWTPPGREFQLAEFNGEESSASLKFEVWISEACASPGKVSFSVDVADSGWRNGARETLSFEMTLDEGVRFPEIQARLESDLPGSSKGKNQARIGPEVSYELSFGLGEIDVAEGEATHHFGVAKSILIEHDKKPFPWPLKSHSRQLVPTNDHDFSVVSKATYIAWLSENQTPKWMKGPKPELLVAVDVMAAKEAGEPRLGRANGLYLHRGYVLLPLAHLVPPPVRRPPPKPKAVARVPAPKLRVEPNPAPSTDIRKLVISGGVKLNPISMDGSNGVLTMFSGVLKAGKRLKAVGEISTGKTHQYGSTDLLLGVRYSFVAEDAVEFGPYALFGVRDAFSSWEGPRLTRTSGHGRIGMSTEIYLDDALGFTLDLGASSNTDLVDIRGNALNVGAGLVLGF